MNVSHNRVEHDCLCMCLCWNDGGRTEPPRPPPHAQRVFRDKNLPATEIKATFKPERRRFVVSIAMRKTTRIYQLSHLRMSENCPPHRWDLFFDVSMLAFPPPANGSCLLAELLASFTVLYYSESKADVLVKDPLLRWILPLILLDVEDQPLHLIISDHRWFSSGSGLVLLCRPPEFVTMMM